MSVNAGKLRHKMVVLTADSQLRHPGHYWCEILTLNWKEEGDGYVRWQDTIYEIRSRYFSFGPDPQTQFEPVAGNILRIDDKHNYLIKAVINVDAKREEYRFTCTYLGQV
jgi:hypothetical protein